MATISSVFKMQDKATSTLNSVNSSMNSVIEKADQLSAATTDMSAGMTNISPALNSAISSYNNLIAKQEMINEKIELMTRQEKLLVQDLRKEQSAYNQNEKAILRVQKQLFNVRNTKSKLIQQSDALTDEILNQASAVSQVADNTEDIKPPQDGVEKGFSKWQANLVTINQGLQLAKSIMGGLKKGLDFADELSLTKARLDLINDGQRTTVELQDQIFAAAQRSRGAYGEMSQSISKLGLLAGDAFKNNDEIVAFSEMLNKSFKVSGASTQEISSATYQLTQAMAAGKLQGDEFRAIMENAPMLADAIAKYMGKSKGELKELSSEGVITSDIIKNALFKASDDINEKFETMPKTFADATTNIQNVATRTFQPIAAKITEILNSETFNNFLNSASKIIMDIGGVLMWIFNIIGTIYNFLVSGSPVAIGILGALGVAIGVTLVGMINNAIVSLLQYAAAWLAANWQMLLIVGIIGIIIGVLYALKTPLELMVAIIGIIVFALAAWKIAQWAVNSAMYACPIVWIIVLVIALIVAIFAFMQWMAKATKLANSGLGMIAGGVMVVIGFFKNLGLAVANIALGIWNALGAVAENIGIAFSNVIKSIQSWFYGLLGTVMDVIAGIVKTLNKLPFVDIDMSGIESKAKEYAKKKADAEGGKQDYKNIGEAFDKGMNTFEAFKDGWVMEEFNKGAAWGDSVQGKIEDAIGSFDPSNILGMLEDPGSQYGGYDMASMIDGNGNIPVDVKKNSDKEVDISDEDLKMLRDIANRDYMLNYKQITPNVNIEFGDVKETADVGKIKDELKRMMEEELAELYVVEEG